MLTSRKNIYNTSSKHTTPNLVVYGPLLAYRSTEEEAMYVKAPLKMRKKIKDKSVSYFFADSNAVAIENAKLLESNWVKFERMNMHDTAYGPCAVVIYTSSSV
jgi:hypothetical protein